LSELSIEASIEVSETLNIAMHDFRLTGRPRQADWPNECSVDLDQFLTSTPSEPRQLVPRLCDYANDLLKVR
jgi:hypothetical protein